MTLTLTTIPVCIERDASLRIQFIRTRRRKRVTLDHVAQQMGVSKGAVSRWERGEPAVGEWRIWRVMDWMGEME